jgi:hypothetical protein
MTYLELEPEALYRSRDGMDQWIYLLTKYKNAPYVCGGFENEELVAAQGKARDAMGGVGYNVNLMKTSAGCGEPKFNANWGAISPGIAFSVISYPSSRCMYASSFGRQKHRGVMIHGNETNCHARTVIEDRQILKLLQSPTGC